MQSPAENQTEFLRYLFEPFFILLRIFEYLLIAIFQVLNDLFPLIIVLIPILLSYMLIKSLFFPNFIRKPEIKEDIKDPQLYCPNCQEKALEYEDFCYTCGRDLNIQKEKGEMLEALSMAVIPNMAEQLLKGLGKKPNFWVSRLQIVVTIALFFLLFITFSDNWI